MITLPITLIVAATAALLNIWLGIRINLLRQRHKIFMGHGGNDAIAARMRAHANFTESAPLFLILLGLVELAHGASTWLWLLGIAFILGRIVHAFGMDRSGSNWLRAAGMIVTWGGLIILVGYALVLFYTERNAVPAITYADLLRAPVSTLSATNGLVIRS